MEQADPSTKDNPDRESEVPLRGEVVAWALLIIVAGVFLFGSLGAKYLWQDEAATAVLGDRLMKFGAPLGYDGVNLITMDYLTPEDAKALDQLTGSAEGALRYYAERGDFKQNTAWIGQPWGQFVVVGVSLRLFGHSTVAARAPFALAALLTVALLSWFVYREFHDSLLAWLASAVLVTNVCWVIHVRQCRYYALSSLLLVVTLIAYTRWQRQRPWGACLFVATAWCWFQVDYGSFWPMLGILLAAAAWAAWPRVLGVVGVSLALGAALAPWVWYYELANRLKPALATWSDRFLQNLFHFDQFLIPLLLLGAALVVLALRWRALDAPVRQILGVSLAMLLAALVWVPTVAPHPFHRYIVHLAPLAALVAAWVLTEGAAWIIRRRPREQRRILIAVGAAGFLAVCPVLSHVGKLTKAAGAPRAYSEFRALRPEWALLSEEVFAPQPDPIRLTVEALARVASPGDEILVNYEDIPLMFYTDYRIRGGMSGFRIEDASRGPPRFLVYRPSCLTACEPALRREILRYRWQPIYSEAPDIPWGNIPEPELRVLDASSKPKLLLAENLGPAQPDQAPGQGQQENR